MKNVAKIGAQGDVLFIRVDKIPENAVLQPAAEEYVVAHSETGHHHVARGKNLSYYTTDNPMESFLEFRGKSQEIKHLREDHTHETLNLLNKIDEALDENETAKFRIIRQRQHTPEGWERVVD